ncbi:hypothetical protein MON38_03710 [Hymenobacter sp. DH14]|uniref:Uncharacterized protein n=1 Tax=Hymenobacter cyanobacteriorum TaxID=2926463 RepID=A0A9X1VDF1_9BACT|nr:hypothetical protein [Hymenobacter cyanobacteriorum]MCI1186510.1 hypothetical protein [Hymenobacter cyanobacteriorum]
MPADFPANNAPERPRSTAWLLGALLAVALLRLWRLPEVGPPDFDSVRNWQVVQEMAQGNFTHLFHHGSPGFLLLFAPVAFFTQNFLVFQTINALLGVVGLGWFAAWVARQVRLSGPEAAGVVLLGGTGLLLTFSGRDFTMSSASLLVAAGLWRSHYARLHDAAPRRLVQAAAWLALGLCINYKFLFAVPILMVLEWWQADGLWRRAGGRALLVLATPYVLLGLLGVAVGLPWYRWLGFYWRTVVPATANVAGRQSTLHLDFLYYPSYLATFESPLLLAGLAAALALVAHQWHQGQPRRSQPLYLLPYLLAWAGCLLAGMSLLIKAPRGLLFAYLPLAALVVLSGRQLLPRLALVAVLLAAVSLNLYRLQVQLFAPLPGRYPAVAAWLRQHGATRVASTVGNGLAPYLGPGQQLTVISDERELAGLRRQGVQYVLLDGYWRVAGVARFDSLRRQVPVAAWPAPPLHQPLLFLEHSEFTGLGFAETLAARRAAATDSLPLRLYRLR